MTLVGRLGMTTEQAVSTFARLSNEVFSDEKLIGTPVFKASKLEKTLKNIMRETTGNEDEPMLKQDTSSKKCRVMVFMMSKHNMNSGTPTIIRSYPTSVNPGPDCTIWQALRAATAHPKMFKPMELAEQGIPGSFVDAAMGCGNPIEHVLAEAKRMYPNRRVATIVSIGGGHPCTIQIPEASPFQRIFPTNVIAAMKDIATDNERVAQAMAVRFRGARDAYFRLNVDQGMQSVRLGDWDRLGEVQAHTRTYMNKVETNELVGRAVKATRERKGAIPVEHVDGELQIAVARQELGVKTCPPPTSVYTERRRPVQLAINCLTNSTKDRRVFVFHGLGGAGKTQLALRTVEQTRDHWSDVIYVDATSVETLTSTLRQYATARSLGDTHEATLLWLSSHTRRWLLVFDNADDSSLSLESYFPKGTHGRVLITTRARDIALLAQGPNSDYNVSSMEPEESLQLLLTVARVDLLTFPQDDRDTAITVVQERPQHMLDEHSNMPIKVSGYERTIYATWKMSYELLGERAQKTLWLLAYLQRDRITLEIFRRAVAGMQTFEPTLPLADVDRDALDETKLYLSNFLRHDGAWDLDLFLTTMAEILSCSLISFDRANETYELHTLVQEWIRTVIPYSSQMALTQSTFLITLSFDRGKETQDYAFRRSLELHVNAVMERHEHIDLASAACFGTILNEAGRYKKAQVLHLRVMEGGKEVLGDEHPGTLTAMSNLADTYSDQGLHKQAETLRMQVLEGGERVHGDDHHDTLTAMSNLASTYRKQGLHKQAETLEVQVLEGRKRALGDEHPDTLTAMSNLATTYRKQGLYKQAETLEVQVLEGRRRALGDEHPDTLTAMNNLAATYSDQGLYKQTEMLKVQVLEGRKRALGDEHPDTLAAMNNLAVTYSHQGLYKQAETLEVQVLEGRKRALGDEHPDTLAAMSNLATTYWRQGLYKQAETLEVQVLEGRRRALGDEHPDTLTAMNNLAATYSDQGLYKQTEMLKVQVLEGRKRALGDEHPDTLTAMNNLAVTYSHQGLYKQAETLEVQVLEGRKRALGDEHPDTLAAMSNLATTYWRQGLYKQAETLEVQVLEGRRRALGDEHPDTLTAMNNLAVTYSDQGLYKQAETLQVQALEGRKRALGDEHPDTLSAMHNLGNTYSHQGLHTQAETLRVQVLEGRKRVLGDEHPATLTAMNNLAVTYSSQGLYKQAETLEVQVLEGRKRALGDEHPDTLAAMNNLASTYSYQGLYKQAESLRVQVLEGKKRALGDDHPNTLTAMKNLAKTYKHLGPRRRREYKALKAEIAQRDPSSKLPWYSGLFSF
ncbi:hypothetical protein FRC09_005110 [Ceratobasidium sp. 395]|nr:hypothetical protein FRC09_005110 [Ceratobasidium sp. 395]